MKYDVVIIGAGPAGIFTALELVRNGSDKKILMVERENRWTNVTARKQRPENV